MHAYLLMLKFETCLQLYTNLLNVCKICSLNFQVQPLGITVHSIAFADEADSSLDSISIETGGLSFLYSYKDKSNALNEAFHAIGEIGASQYTLSLPARVH